MEQENSKQGWYNFFNGNEINELPIRMFGFIYILEYETGEYYIGKCKVLFDKVSPVKLNGDKRKNHVKFRKAKSKGSAKFHNAEEHLVQTNWKSYEGSSDEVSKGTSRKLVKKRIIKLIKNNETDIANYSKNMKPQLDYWELYYIFRFNAIIDDKFLNKMVHPNLHMYRGKINPSSKLVMYSEDSGDMDELIKRLFYDVGV